MANRPWTPNHVAFDFTVIFTIVGLFGWVSVHLYPHFIPPVLMIPLVIIVATLWTVSGRRYHRRKAAREHWTVPVGSSEDDDKDDEARELVAAERLQAKWKSEREVFYEASRKIAQRCEADIAQMRQARTEEIQRLENELAYLKKMKIGPFEDTPEDIIYQAESLSASSEENIDEQI
jgi:hypothetical protein